MYGMEESFRLQETFKIIKSNRNVVLLLIVVTAFLFYNLDC